MIIGNGLIGSAFKSYFGDDENVIIFASGVSNSLEKRDSEFLREKELLVRCVSCKKLIVYFSTCSVADPELVDSPYVVHKKEMEAIVRSSNEYAIFRLPQVVGKTHNPNTLTNYLYWKIMSGANFEVWRHATRNLIDVDDVASIVSHLARASLANGITANIASPFTITIPHLVSVFELVLRKKANCSLIEAGGAYTVDSTFAIEAAGQADVYFGEDYIEKLIAKYYGE